MLGKSLTGRDCSTLVDKCEVSIYASSFVTVVPGHIVYSYQSKKRMENVSWSSIFMYLVAYILNAGLTCSQLLMLGMVMLCFSFQIEFVNTVESRVEYSTQHSCRTIKRCFSFRLGIPFSSVTCVKFEMSGSPYLKPRLKYGFKLNQASENWPLWLLSLLYFKLNISFRMMGVIMLGQHVSRVIYIEYLIGDRPVGVILILSEWIENYEAQIIIC